MDGWYPKARIGKRRVRVPVLVTLGVRADRFAAWRSARSVGRGSPSLTAVPAWRQYIQQLLLNDWFIFDWPGSYQIEARLNNPIRDESGQILASSRSGEFRVRIEPLNEEVLRAACERLAAIATRGVADDASAAIGALGSVLDTVAIRYLRQMMSTTNRFDTIIIPALLRIHTDEARAVLTEAAQSADAQRAP